MIAEDSPPEKEEEEVKTNGLPADPSTFVRSTAKNLLTKLETTVKAPVKASNRDDKDEVDDETLQDSEPRPLSDQPKDVEEVLNIISQSICREGRGQQQQLLMNLADLDSLLSVVSHSLSAYITTLDPLPLQRLSSRIAAEVSLWICDLFKFRDGSAYCHDDTREGLVRITRMALHHAYPKMATDGFETLFARPPVIYLTSSTYTSIANHVCVELCLPLSTLRVLPQGTVTREKMEEAIKEDKAAGRLPVLCVANVHSSLFQAMNATAFETTCKENGIWLHLEGHALAGLALVGKDVKNVPTGDSLSLTIGSWLGIPALPFVTVHKSVGLLEACAHSAGLFTVVPSVRLNCLPLWCVLRSLGAKQFRSRIGNMFDLMETINNRLATEFPSLRILSQRPESGPGFLAVGHLPRGDFDVRDMFRTVSPALAFQYVYAGNRERVVVPDDYFNNLNSWLGQTMQRDCPQIPLEIVDVESAGYVLRLCPFESLAFSGTTLTFEDDLAVFVDCLKNQTAIMDATVAQREKFIELIVKEPKLQHVEVPQWAGLGGVSYIPQDVWKDENFDPEKDFTDAQLKIMNQRNVELLTMLRTLDSAFSLGESSNEDVCIRFGMVSMDTDVNELLSLLVSTGTQLDEKLQRLSQMSSLVVKGIEQAAEDLRKESDEAIWQEGVLRHVPLVGSLYNWISPPPKMQIKGRFLSLDEGKLQSTEVIYKQTTIANQHNGLEDAKESIPTPPPSPQAGTELSKDENESKEEPIHQET